MSVDAAKLRRQALIQRIARAYQVIEEPMQIGPMQITFTRIADPNRVLDEVAMEEDRREKATGRRKREDELHLPYWAELWESSLGVAHYLVSEWALCGRGESAVARLAHRAAFAASEEAKHPLVMDLGCGMGLAGTAAARLGARVLFADMETAPLLFARLNSLPDAPRVRARKVNWQTDRLDQRFDLILGADIVYDRSQWQFLAPFFQAHLADGGAVLIGEPGRSSGEEFEPWITARGWHLRRCSQTLPGKDSPIWLLELTVSTRSVS